MQRQAKSDEINVYARGRLLHIREGRLGLWMEELKASMDLGFGSSYLI